VKIGGGSATGVDPGSFSTLFDLNTIIMKRE
jgi:hypothetical protein